jgi:DNA-directed RNA polymerase sigma subunit (sigma70/sigma32)
MKFNDLTETDKEYIIHSYLNRGNISWEKTAQKLGDEYKVTERTMRRWLSENLKSVF